MMKKLFLLLILFLLCAAPRFAFEDKPPEAPLDNTCTFRVMFKNTTDQKVLYFFFWVDHPFDSNLPVNMATGELAADDWHIVGFKYKCGEYYVKWLVGDDSYTYSFSQRSFHDKLRILKPQ